MKSTLPKKDLTTNAKKLAHRVLDDPKVLEALAERDECRVRHAMVRGLKTLSEGINILYGKWITMLDAEQAARLIALSKPSTPSMKLREWICRKCYNPFYADGIFDALRQMELQVLSRVGRFVTPDDARRWVFCPKCWAADIRKSEAEEEQGEAYSVATTVDVAGMIMEEIKTELPKFENSEKARREVMDLLWSLCASLSRGCELAREDAEPCARPVEKKTARPSTV